MNIKALQKIKDSIESLVFYNHLGDPLFFLRDGVGYSYKGDPLFFLKDNTIYSFRGDHLGWVEDGWVLDTNGDFVFYTEKAPNFIQKPAVRVHPTLPITSVTPVYPTNIISKATPYKTMRLVDYRRTKFKF